MLMKVTLVHMTERDPVETGRALTKDVLVTAESGDEAAAKATAPGWIVRGVEGAPADAVVNAMKAEADKPAVAPKRGRPARTLN